MPFNRRKPLTPSEAAVRQVDKSIASLERSNHFIVRAAHTFAFALIIATSVASLVALAGQVVQLVVRTGGNVPVDASLIITLLLVMAMDTGMIYAATMIRIGAQRGQGIRQLWGYGLIMGMVALLEAGTYTYFLALYEHPANGVAWALVIARGVAVPALSIFLSMAKRITINTEDIARLIEVFAGVGLLKDMARDANDPTAPLDHKIAVYRAAATLSPAQRSKLDAMYVAVTGRPMPRIVEATIEEITDTAEIEAPGDVVMATSTAPRATAGRARMKPKAKTTRKPKTTAQPDDTEAQVFAYLDGNASASVTDIMAATGVARGTASTYKRMWTQRHKATRAAAGPVTTGKGKAPPAPDQATLDDIPA